MENFPAALLVYHEQIIFRALIEEISAQLDSPEDWDFDLRRKAVRPVQLRVNYVYKEFYQATRERSFQFDMDMLKNYYDDSHGILSTTLVLVGIKRDDEWNEYLVKNIIDQGLKIGNRVCNRGRKELGLRVFMERAKVKYYCARCSLEMRARAEIIRTRMLMNNGNGGPGMVPASDSSIKKVLKRVRVGDDDDDHVEEEEEGREGKRRRICASECESCTVCMEEFKAGGSEGVACMPCSHVFHEECIVTWLRQSHYCPVCRFEVPTTDD